jgi:hypothetical protein
MEKFGSAEDLRRRLLINGLAAGLFAAVLPGRNVAAASESGAQSGKLAAGQSIYRISGTALVNGNEATLTSFIGPNDTIQTAKDSEIIFVVGTNVMILRGESHVELQGDRSDALSLLISGLRIISGKILSVSRNQRMSIKTPTAILGIRGTGVYIEADAELTYLCTCYGTVDVAASGDPASRDSVTSSHHDRPLYITAGAEPGNNIQPAGFKEHTDQELMLIETLVGRTTPFSLPANNEAPPRRSY